MASEHLQDFGGRERLRELIYKETFCGTTLFTPGLLINNHGKTFTVMTSI